MSYQYEFDHTRVGDLRLSRAKYELLQEGCLLMRDELRAWNDRAVQHGATTRPYEREVADLEGMIEWGSEKLSHFEVNEVIVSGISVGSLRYAKAALMLVKRKREEDISKKRKEGWPTTVLTSLEEGANRVEEIIKIINHKESDVLWEIVPKSLDTRQNDQADITEWDVFISHASEDKDEFVRPLAQLLDEHGLKVWFDELTLTLGDSLRRSIDRGLAHSRFGIVVISPNFLGKEWPQKELDGLVAREVDGEKVILPIWHNMTASEIRRYSPMLADRIAVSSEKGLDFVVVELERAISAESRTSPSDPQWLERRKRAGANQTKAAPDKKDTWASLDEWIVESLERWQEKREALPPDTNARCPLGYWWAGYQIEGAKTGVTASKLRDIMATERSRYTTWPLWPTVGGDGIPVIPQGDGIECWMGQKEPERRQPRNADFWRASPRGLFFQLRGYETDSEETEPQTRGRVFNLVIPIWRIGECLLHAQEMAAQLAEEEGNIWFRTGWSGLEGRRLQAPNRLVDYFEGNWVSGENYVETRNAIKMRELLSNLVGIVWDTLRPLYEKFGFFNLSKELVEQEINLMVSRKF